MRNHVDTFFEGAPRLEYALSTSGPYCKLVINDDDAVAVSKLPMFVHINHAAALSRAVEAFNREMSRDETREQVEALKKLVEAAE